MLLIFLVILLCFLLLIKEIFTENFSYVFQNNFNWLKPYLRSTKNMSYDLRGDPIIIPRHEYIWNNPK